VRYCKITGNRTGIDINNSNGNNIHDNIIDNNRTGMIFRNQTDNTIVTRNDITNNWTAGIVFLDASGGSNSPVQTAIGSTFSNNNISGNWYAQVEDRQVGGSLPAAGTNTKNFECNWFGLTAVKKSNTPGGEPGYSSQIPVVFGGSAVAPAETAGQIRGIGVDNIDYEPWLITGNDDSTLAGFQQNNPICAGQSLTLTQNDLITAIDCKDESSAYLDFTISGGVKPYTISLNGVSYVTNDASYINDTIGTSGTYTLVVADSIGSSETVVFTVTEPSNSLKITATPTHPLCSSDLGSIALSATGGTAPLSVDVNGAVYGANQTVSVGPGDTYTIIVTDNNGCIAETEVTIDAAPDPLEFDASTASTDALCAGLNGELVFLANGGTGTINYTVNGVAASSPILTTAATYTIVATDANSCSISTALIINQPLGISIVVSNVTNPNCFGEDGSFNLRGVGGTSIDSTGFTYVVNTENYDFNDKFYGSNGTYTVTVTDAINTICSVSTVVTLTEPALLEVNTTMTDVNCFGGNGTYAYEVSGGTAPYTIDINGGVFTSATGSLTKPAGNYTITVSDANGCSVDPIEDEIMQPLSALTFTSTASNSPDCFGQAGSIEFLAEGGTGDIEYTIANNVVTSPYSAVAGTYTVTATDENGCSTTTAILLEAPTQVNFTSVVATNLDCFGDTDGSIDFEAAGGTGGISYTVNTLSDVTPVQSLIAGVYTIVATDEKFCTAVTTVTITQPNDIVITADVTNPSCNSANGAVAFSAIGGIIIVIFYYFLVDLLKRNKEALLKKKLMHFSLLFILFFIAIS
ncbi:MAG: hypothetical protein FGM54_08225, partial [Chitinophagaceae bacterium]|nr:hypothetical protein [Chitinophagaceae bacterium]